MTTSDLADRRCVPCEGGIDPLTGEALEAYRKGLEERWGVVDEHHLEAEFDFDDFASALDFAVAVGEIAEAEGHHPEITIGWGHASVRVWTHAIDGLSENDFILAAKIDRGPGSRAS